MGGFGRPVSKLRNVECRPGPREASYDQLQVAAAAGVDGGSLLAVTRDRLAFAHHLDGGGAIQVKALDDTGREDPTRQDARRRLLRGHCARVQTLAFSPFDPALLLSGAADGVVKLWRLDAAAFDGNEAASTSLQAGETAAPVSHLQPHPTVRELVAAAGRAELRLWDLAAETPITELPCDGLSGLAWNYDGSLVVTASATVARRRLGLVDPRAPTTSDAAAIVVDDIHGGHRPIAVTWCGRTGLVLTAGSDRLHARELKLWDPRYLGTGPVHRERLDTGMGALVPLYDPDLDLVLVLGRGDRSLRVLELEASGHRLQPLAHVPLPHATLAGALVPKDALDTAACEVARVLSLSAAACDVVTCAVPRRDAARAFQADLYPDTAAPAPALGLEAWRRGDNAPPRTTPVVRPPSVSPTPAPTPTPVETEAPIPMGPRDAVAAASGWGAMTWAPCAPAAPTATATDAWNSKTPAWNAPAAPPPTATTVFGGGPTPPSVWGDAPQSATVDTRSPMPSSSPSSPKSPPANAPSWRASSSHKLKFLEGRLGPRLDVAQLSGPAAAAPRIKASAAFWAVPLAGPGGPVQVAALGRTGRLASAAGDPVLNGQRGPVLDLDFDPFDPAALATGADDGTLAIWDLGHEAADTPPTTPRVLLRGHTRGLRSVLFHPTARGVVATSALDLTLRLWDVAAERERACVAGRLEDAVWNMSFSPDGHALATASRARIVRIFDPRAPAAHALVAMGCGLDSPRAQYVTWLSPTRLATVGTGPRLDVELRIWDARSLLDPLATVTVGSSSGSGSSGGVTPVPCFDDSSRVLYLVGLGGHHIWSYEVDTAAETTAPGVHANLPFALADGGPPLSAAALLPKHVCDVAQVEVGRLLLLRHATVEPASFTLPRAERLRGFFQDDVFGPVRSWTRPALAADAYFDGAPLLAPPRESLQPLGMIPLSQRPPSPAPTTSKSRAFRAQWEQEARERRLKDEQLARLERLAAQPSLHGLRPSSHAPDDDDDDDWDN